MLVHNVPTGHCCARTGCIRLPHPTPACKHQHRTWHNRLQHPQRQHAHQHHKSPRHQQAVLREAPVSAAPPQYDRQEIEQLFATRPDLAIRRGLQVCWTCADCRQPQTYNVLFLNQLPTSQVTCCCNWSRHPAVMTVRYSWHLFVTTL